MAGQPLRYHVTLVFILAVLALGTVLVLLVPAVDTFCQFAQPRPGNPDSEKLAFVAIPIVLLALVVELFGSFWVDPRKRLALTPHRPTWQE